MCTASHLGNTCMYSIYRRLMPCQSPGVSISNSGMVPLACPISKAKQLSLTGTNNVVLQANVLVPHMTASNLSTVAWAYWQHRHYSAPLYRALAARALEIMDTMGPQNSALLALSFARQRHKDGVLFEALGDQAVKTMRDALPHNMGIVARGFGEAKVRSGWVLGWSSGFWR